LNEFESGDVLLVAQRDRLGRDPIIVAVLEKKIEELGGSVLSVAGEGTGGDSPSDILIRRIVDAISEYVRLNGKLRVKMALKSKKDRGERTGGIPYGYGLASDGVHLEKNDHEQRIIAFVKDLRGMNMSYSKICKELYIENIVSRNGKPFQPEQVRRMVK
jgi:DNA invertase Pin-like site-specific DNA recombinase